MRSRKRLLTAAILSASMLLWSGAQNVFAEETITADETIPAEETIPEDETIPAETKITADASTGDVTAEFGDITSDSNGVYVDVSEGVSATVTTGAISTDGNGVEEWVADAGSKASVTVNGDIETTTYSGAFIVVGDDNTGDITVNGDISAETVGLLLCDYGDQGGTINAVVNGDVSGKKQGLSYVTLGDGDALDVLVTGTVSGGDVGVSLLVDPSAPLEEKNLTVWAIDVVDGMVAADEDRNGEVSFSQNEDFEKGIMYIIKVEQPEEGAVLKAVDANGNALATSHDYDVALEGDKVLLKVELNDGYSISKAFNGEGQETELLMDEEGNYYIVVPKGGGVYLSAQIEKNASAPTSDDAATTQKTSATTTQKTTTASVTQKTITASVTQKSPSTGDHTNPLLWMLMSTALAASAACLLRSKKNR